MAVHSAISLIDLEYSNTHKPPQTLSLNKDLTFTNPGLTMSKGTGYMSTQQWAANMVMPWGTDTSGGGGNPGVRSGKINCP